MPCSGRPEQAAASIPATGNEIADIYIEATDRVLMPLAWRQIAIASEHAEKERHDIQTRVRDGTRAAKLEAAQHGIEKDLWPCPRHEIDHPEERRRQGRHCEALQGFQRDALTIRRESNSAKSPGIPTIDTKDSSRPDSERLCRNLDRDALMALDNMGRDEIECLSTKILSKNPDKLALSCHMTGSML